MPSRDIAISSVLVLSSDGKKRLDLAGKITATAGSLSVLYCLPMVAQGAIISANPGPSQTLGSNSTVTWSVDGNGATFGLKALFGSTSGSVAFTSNALGRNGNGVLVTVGGNFRRLAASNFVGAGYFFGAKGSRSVLFATTSGPPTPEHGLQNGDNYIGFRFTEGANTYVGWADIFLDLPNGKVSIVDGAYNNTPGGSIHLLDGSHRGSAPEPSSLALLALGAGGLAAFRRRKAKNAAAAT